MNTLLELAGSNVANRVVKGEISLKTIDNLDRGSRASVLEKIIARDFYNWKYDMMKCLALIELKKCKKFNIEWEKFYMDGTRDFREVIYIFHDGDEKFISEEDMEITEDELEDDYVPEIKVKEINCYNDYYYHYLDALYLTQPDSI